MNLHEYQAKEILREAGIPVPDFAVVSQLREVDEAIHSLHLKEAVVKIQVHAGGRGKGGGVVFAKTPEEIRQVATRLIGMRLINHQTGLEGLVAHQVLLSHPTQIEKEFYLGAIIDRVQARPLLIASPDGGMEIETIAETHPDRILKIPILPDGRIRPYNLLYLAKFMGWTGSLKEAGLSIAQKVAQVFIKTDASLLEINPLVLDPAGKFWALDAKLSIDDNALYRQPKIASLFDPTQVSSEEVAAKAHDLAYIALDGNIGCMVNGAGLAMATMDQIRASGGAPANFLDVGGGATAEKISAGFEILLSDPRVKAILVNIFGGIMSCETIAEGILAVAANKPIRVPLVIRMKGTNVQQGEEILRKSGLAIFFTDSLQQAATKAVGAVSGHTHS